MSPTAPVRTTLYELIDVLCELTPDDAEVVAVARHLLVGGPAGGVSAGTGG